MNDSYEHLADNGMSADFLNTHYTMKLGTKLLSPYLLQLIFFTSQRQDNAEKVFHCEHNIKTCICIVANTVFIIETTKIVGPVTTVTPSES